MRVKLFYDSPIIASQHPQGGTERPRKGICLIWSRGRLFSPSLSCRGQCIGKQRGSISSWHKRTAGRNLVVHRHGTTLRQSVQRYRCRLYFSLFFFFSAILILRLASRPKTSYGKMCFIHVPCHVLVKLLTGIVYYSYLSQFCILNTFP